MANEVYSWMEGRVLVWTGTATASALVGYMQNMQAIGVYGWEDRQTVAGVYSQHQTGQLMSIAFQYFYGLDATLAKMIQSATAMHLKIDHSSPANGSGGLFLWSAVVDSFALVGAEGSPYTWSINLHGHEWSHYGNG